jgi:hypothetical protein
MTEAWAIYPSCGLVHKATVCRTPNSPGGRTEFLSGHWPASVVDAQNCRSIANDPLNLQRDRDVTQTAARRES